MVLPRIEATEDALTPDRPATAAACRLCRIGASTAIWDRVLWESENFRVVPSKGGFVAGWLMVVPQAHVLSMAHLSPTVYDELDELVADISARLTDRFGPPTAFEHGAVTENTPFGCGIDHAHLHLVPLSDDVPLRALAEQALGKKFIVQPAAPTGPYLRVREPVDPGFGVLEPLISPPRQFFRQLIWRARAWHVHSYDYDLAPCREQVRATVAALGRL
jgi:diadenosine tetraphosphate (Ap4A) HIT family hydrolase